MTDVTLLVRKFHSELRESESAIKPAMRPMPSKAISRAYSILTAADSLPINSASCLFQPSSKTFSDLSQAIIEQLILRFNN